MSADASPAAPGVFGDPPARLVTLDPAARQFSPLCPGAAVLEDVPPGTLSAFVMRAAAGTLERRHDLAAMLRALAPHAPFVVLAPKDGGGARLRRELAAFGLVVEEGAKAHHRICRGTVPPALDAAPIDAAFADGAPRRLPGLGIWSQPGVFCWDGIDPGTALLRTTLPPLSGRGADLGCGLGVLAHGILAHDSVRDLSLIDIDRRAIEAARRNVDDPRVRLFWADVAAGVPLDGLDFVVMNPPFHQAGEERRSLGQTFIRRAAEALRKGGRLWLVANRHLPYEDVLRPLFRQVTPQRDADGYKVIESVK